MIQQRLKHLAVGFSVTFAVLLAGEFLISALIVLYSQPEGYRLFSLSYGHLAARALLFSILLLHFPPSIGMAPLFRSGALVGLLIYSPELFRFFTLGQEFVTPTSIAIYLSLAIIVAVQWGTAAAASECAWRWVARLNGRADPLQKSR